MKARVWKATVLIAAAIVLGLVGFGSYSVVHYLRTSPRFEVRNVSVLGLERVTESQALAQAGLQSAENLFLVDLDAVRERLEQLKWVRFASVKRVFPDAISIRIYERQPVGLARIRGEFYQFDQEATLLSGEVSSSFPILDGLTLNSPEKNLKKVQTYLRVMDDLHGQSELSEIHINDAGEVAVVSLSEPLLINLGSENLRDRWAQYLHLRPVIQEECPDAVEVDFRFADQIILKTHSDVADHEVIWDGGKKSL